jgi:hypothetical protein
MAALADLFCTAIASNIVALSLDGSCCFLLRTNSTISAFSFLMANSRASASLVSALATKVLIKARSDSYVRIA